jgi:DNA replication licensing factor MCM5
MKILEAKSSPSWSSSFYSSVLIIPSFTGNDTRGSRIGFVNMFGRDQIRENVLLKQYYCDVDVGHLISFNEELAHRLVTEPAEIIPLVSHTIF